MSQEDAPWFESDSIYVRVPVLLSRAQVQGDLGKISCWIFTDLRRHNSMNLLRGRIEVNVRISQ